MVYTFQRLAAPNDRNGNPRRLWVICDQRNYDWKNRFTDQLQKGALVARAVLTEGYKGRAVVAEWFADHPRTKRHPVLELPDINVTATEYRDWVRLARASDSIELREE